MFPPRKGFSQWSLLKAATVLTASLSSAHGVLIYEGFTGYTAGQINGQQVNGNTIGLDTATTYGASTAFNYTASGLAFSILQTSGGAATISGTGGVTGGATIDLATPYTETLYSSYLVNVTSFGTGTANTAVIRINTAPTAAVADARFRLDAVSGDSTSDLVGVTYDTTVTNGSGQLAAGTTYLMLGRFTNPNATLSAGSPGVATGFALTAAQFEFFYSDGQLTDVELDSAAVGSGLGEVTGKATETLAAGTEAFADGNAIQFASASLNWRFDEIRYGTSFTDVTPTIPEPGTASLAALGLLFLCGVRGGSRKS